MSQYSDATDAALTAERAAAAVSLEQADANLREAQRQLAEQLALVADLRTVNSQLTVKVSELLAEIDRLQAIIDGGGDPPPVSETLIGVSGAADPAGPFEGDSPTVRIFSEGAVDGDVLRFNPKRIALSDEGVITTASQLDAALARITAKHSDLIIDWFHENEVTVGVTGWSAAKLALYLKTVHEMRLVCDKYPNVNMSIDLTAYEIRQGNADRLKLCAPDLEIIYSSCYPPGRKDSPPTRTEPAEYIDPVLDLVKDWGVPAFGCGEYGTSLSPLYDRPTVAAEAVQYMDAGCKSRGIKFVAFHWWNHWKGNGPDNRLVTDDPLTAEGLRNALPVG